MKRTTSIILIIMMILAFPLNAYSSYLVDKGVCGMNGDNITWTLDSDGLLTISGTGEIPEFPGWDPSGVIVMDIQPGITSIGKDACSGSGAIQVNIPEGVISIKDGAFDYSNSLTHIVIPNGVKTLGKYCFSRCQNLSRVELPSSLESIDNQCFNYFLLKDIYYTGTEEQWNKIDIYNRDNLEKQNTRIHFNSHMPDDTRIAVATVEYPQQYTYGYRGKVTIENLKSEAIFIAVFYKDDAVIFEGQKTIQPGERIDETFVYRPPTNLWPIPYELKPTSCKLFLWNNLEETKPLCEAYEIKLTTH